MSSKFELDLATLHIEPNISHTIALANVTTSPKALEKLLDGHCSCTLREIIFDSQLGTLDITNCSIETQLRFLTQLASERFDSTCFTINANDTIYVKCFLSPDPGICILKWNVTLEEASSFKNETTAIPVDSKLHLACLVTDYQYVQNLMKQTSGRVDTKDLLFYGISCEEIVDVILQIDKTGVNAIDKCGRTPLFYALTSSLDTARKLLENGARATTRDKCKVTVLTYFAEYVLKNRLPVPIKYEGLELLSSNGMQREKMIKEVVNLIFCKFIQVLGSVCAPPNSPDGYLKPKMLCETLKWVLGQNESDDERNALVNQLQGMPDNIPADNETICDVVRPVFDILSRLGAKPSQARDSEGNTCLHYAARLVFHGVPRETVTYICKQLMKIDTNMKLNAKNHKEETPLLFCLSSTDLIASSETNNWSESLRAVCRLLIDSGSELRYTTIKEESVFQLILKLSQYAILLSDSIQKQCIFEEMLEILEIFSSEENQRSITVNKRDVHLNSPLHLWASLALASSNDYGKNVFDEYSFERLLKRILDLLLECGVQLDDKNERGETPLHVCRTWTAVTLLLGAGANPSVTDSLGRTPLLAAAMNNTCLKKGSDHFYPDVTQDPRFWNDALDKKLDPWIADKNGESVLSTLIDKEANDLSKALIECACSQNMQIDTIGIPLLVTVCKDKSIEKGWKFDLVKKLLDTKRSLVHGRLSSSSSKDTALHFCCRIILELPENAIQSSVHWKIIQYLLLCGADVKTAGESDESCEDLSHICPRLRDLLSKDVDYNQLPIVLDQWKESSVEHNPKLSLVARMIKYQEVECKRDKNPLYFSNEPLDTDKGTFGLVFVGIIHDGREVAVKRIVKANLPNGGVKSVLVPAQQCDQIVRYIFCKEDQHFYYVAFDLMEGNLENYLDRTRASASRCEDSTKLCKDILLGLQFLQCQGVVHGNINPSTVFYQIQGRGMCLKIGNCVAKSARRAWTPSEVLKSASLVFSNESDIFSCGLVLHYLLSDKKHPFAPVDCTTKTTEKILQETETNILNGHIVIDDSLSPEASHLVQLMLDRDPSSRPSAAEALAHPFFWDMKTKKRFLHVVANEPEIAVQQKRYPLTAFEYDLEKKFSTIVTKACEWNDQREYDKIDKTEDRMRVRPRNGYNYSTVAGLVRFIRNAYEHINEQPDDIKTMWETDFVLHDYFPNLLIEVYKAFTNSEFHQLHKSREGIKKFFSEL